MRGTVQAGKAAQRYSSTSADLGDLTDSRVEGWYGRPRSRGIGEVQVSSARLQHGLGPGGVERRSLKSRISARGEDGVEVVGA